MDIQAEKIELIKLLTEVKSKTIILKIKDILKSEKIDETDAIAANPAMKKKLDKSISQINEGNYTAIKTEDLWK